jgi:hypothetical protein
LRAEAPRDAGTDAATLDASVDTAPCWIPDSGAYDPNDPTAEAQRRVWELARSASAYLLAQQATDAGPPYIWSAPRTPNPPHAACASDPAGTWDSPEWSRLGFRFAAGESYRYSYEVDALVSQFTARAVGDLDGDGVESTFEVAGSVEADGGPVFGTMWVYRGLE